MKATILAACGLAGLLTAGVPARDDGDPGAAALQGTWVAVGAETGGEKLPRDKVDALRMTLTINGNKYAVAFGDKVEEEGTFKIAPGKGMGTIDITIATGKDRGKQQVGVYAVEGDTLTICYAAPGVESRPTALTTKADEPTTATTLRRQKDRK